MKSKKNLNPGFPTAHLTLDEMYTAFDTLEGVMELEADQKFTHALTRTRANIRSAAKGVYKSHKLSDKTDEYNDKLVELRKGHALKDEDGESKILMQRPGHPTLYDGLKDNKVYEKALEALMDEYKEVIELSKAQQTFRKEIVIYQVQPQFVPKMTGTSREKIGFLIVDDPHPDGFFDTPEEIEARDAEEAAEKNDKSE